jgi:hypothetical protein
MLPERTHNLCPESRRMWFGLPLRSRNHLLLLVVTAFLLALAPVNFARSAEGTPGAHVPLPSGSPGGQVGPGPTVYCYDCKIPKGYVVFKGDPDQQCVDKRVECMCASPGNPPVESVQPLCLYPAIPIPKVKP